MSMGPLSVVALQVFFSYDNDLCVRELAALKRAIGKQVFPSMHDKRHIALVMVTDERPEELVDRLRPVLEVDAISNYWAMVPTTLIAGKFGGMDTFVSRVRQAYALKENRTKPKNVSYIQVPIRKHRHHDAIRQVPVKAPSDRQMPKNTDR